MFFSPANLQLMLPVAAAAFRLREHNCFIFMIAVYRLRLALVEEDRFHLIGHAAHDGVLVIEVCLKHVGVACKEGVH